jgi:pyruvate kinase
MFLNRTLLSLSRNRQLSVGVGGVAGRSLSAFIGKKTTFNLPDPSDVNAHRHRQQLVKIVATIGPTSEQAEPMLKVVSSGMRVMRLNFSHATKEEVELRCTNLQAAQEKLGRNNNVRAILLDTKGPEIRTGKLANDDSGHETVTLQAGDRITLHTSASVRDAGSSATNLYIDYAGLPKCLKPGMKVLLDDGAIFLSVESTDVGNGTVTCKINNTGDLRSRAGVNLPLADISDLPAMSDKDKADIKYGMTKDIDFVAASFVQTAQGVREIRAHIQQCAKELGWSDDMPLPLIISKIETAGALTHFDEILQESDAIMVARGDLGVEIPLQQVTNAQNEMAAACNAAGKPVIVATQMLESMSKNPRPTRAEVSDVTHSAAHADCVMLSGM